MASDVPRASDVENILKIDAEIANREHDSAHAEFLKVCSGGTSAELQESSLRVQFALEAHTLAAKRLKDFLRDGTVPENL